MSSNHNDLHGSLWTNKRNTRFDNHTTNPYKSKPQSYPLFALPAVSAAYPPSKQFNWLNPCELDTMVLRWDVCVLHIKKSDVSVDFGNH